MATQVWPLDTADAVSHPAGGEARRARRHALSVGRAGACAAVAGTTDAATLLDLSIYGCRLATAGALAEGDRLWLRFDGGWPIAATVIWATDGRLGCRFDETIPSTTMRELTRSLI